VSWAAAVVFLLPGWTPLRRGDVHAFRGFEAFNAGEYLTALDELEQAIHAGVTEYELGEVYIALGDTHFQLESFDESITAFEAAIEQNPESHIAWASLGIVHRYTGDFGRAEECFERALIIEPDNAELHIFLGVLYIIKEEPHQAVQALERSVGLDPQLADAHGNLALAYAMAGRFDDADASLRQAMALEYEDWVFAQRRNDALKAPEEGD